MGLQVFRGDREESLVEGFGLSGGEWKSAAQKEQEAGLETDFAERVDHERGEPFGWGLVSKIGVSL